MCRVRFLRKGMEEVLDWSEEEGKSILVSLRTRLSLAGTLQVAVLNTTLGFSGRKNKGSQKQGRGWASRDTWQVSGHGREQYLQVSWRRGSLLSSSGV